MGLFRLSVPRSAIFNTSLSNPPPAQFSDRYHWPQRVLVGSVIDIHIHNQFVSYHSASVKAENVHSIHSPWLASPLVAYGYFLLIRWCSIIYGLQLPQCLTPPLWKTSMNALPVYADDMMRAYSPPPHPSLILFWTMGEEWDAPGLQAPTIMWGVIASAPLTYVPHMTVGGLKLGSHITHLEEPVTGKPL